MTFFGIAFALFLMMDPIGNIPLFLQSLRHFKPSRQRFILVREMVIALALIIAFQYGGEALLQLLHIGSDALYISGGIILFLVAVQMVFHKPAPSGEKKPLYEPLIVPLAVPYVAGPAILAEVMIFAVKEPSNLKITLAIIAAWIPSAIILYFSSFLLRILGEKGVLALEKLMGLILTLMATQMVLSGLRIFFNGSA